MRTPTASASVGVHDPEVELSLGKPLVGSQVEPAHGFGIVLEDALAVGVPDPEVELRIGETLVGSQPEPPHGFGSVLEDALAVAVPDPEVELRGGITLSRSLADRVEIVLCREHHDCEATRHDHSSGCADQPWYFIDRLQMWATLLSPDPRSLSDFRRKSFVFNDSDFLA